MNRKALLLPLALVCLFITTNAQTYDSVGYYNQMNYLYARLDKSQIANGLLKDYAIEFNNWDNFHGNHVHDSNFVSLTEWRLLYTGLYSSRIRSTPSMLYLDTLNRRLNKYSQTNQPISMAVLYYRYQNIKSNALSSNLLRNENGQLVDVAGRTQSPYESKALFAIAPIRQATYTGTTQIIFRSDLFFGNTGRTVRTIEIQVNGSSTWQTVAMNTPFNLTFTNEGFYNIITRITYTDNWQRISHTKLAVYAKPDNGTSSIKLRKQSSLSSVSEFAFAPDVYGDNPLPIVEPITATRAHLGAFAAGEMTIEFAQSNATGQIRKPLIVVEGFDLNNGFGYGQFIQGININSNGRPPTAITFNGDLDDIGEYDIIFLNFVNATDFIQRNAYLLEAVIQEVNRRKTTFAGVRQQNVILGLSMGGVVARYALRDMENLGVPHETRLSIAHDSPFKGANIPVSYQVAAQHLGRWKIINGVSANFPFISYADMIPEVANLLNAYLSPAARQLIIQRYTLSGNGTISANNTEYNNFQNELNNLGWPQNCRTITVSNGSCNGTKVFNNSNANFFQIAGERTSFTYFGALWRSLALTLGGALEPTKILTQGFGANQPNRFALIWEYPLTYLSTGYVLGINFSCSAVPTSGTAEIYRGQIFSRKRVLGIFNITSNFVSLVVNSQTSMIPLDEAPGGVYDLENFGLDPNLIQAQLPEFFRDFVTTTINQAGFCFVPTVSSIAHNNAANSWFSAVCGTVECTTPNQVTDFYLQNANQLHISYTQANGDWIVQRQDAAFACVKICTNNLSISGNSPMCANGVFTVNAPAGAVVTWSVSPANIATIVPNGNSVTVNRVSNGTINLTATISNSCQAGRAVTRSIIIGPPPVNIAYSMSGGCNGSYQGWMLNASSTSPVTSWQWTVDNPSSGDWYIDNPTSPNTYVSVSGGGGISVTATNACGTTRNGVTIYSNCGFGITASPNPTADEVTIAVKEPENSKATNKKVVMFYQINVADASGNIRKQFKYPSGTNRTRISLAGLPKGVYTVQAFDGSTWSGVQVIKQ